MAYLLKQKTESSPGVIVLTGSEALLGPPKKSRKVRDLLLNTASKGEWIYGIHIQGDYSHMSEWPLEEWHGFIMSADPDAGFLKNVPRDMITEITCANFVQARNLTREKFWDICIVSRPSKIKKIEESMLILKELLRMDKSLKFVVVAPDPRLWSGSKRKNNSLDLEDMYFYDIKNIFSSEELKNISFISSSQESFGNFPVSQDLIAALLAQSKFTMLNSRKEGGPRVVVESLMLGTPCIVSKDLKCGVRRFLNSDNTIFIDSSIKVAAGQIIMGLRDYGKFNINNEIIENEFCDEKNYGRLKAYVERRIFDLKKPSDGMWFLNNLDMNLASHGQKYNFQILNSKSLFIKWLESANEAVDSHAMSEDLIFGSHGFGDKIGYIDAFVLNPINIVINNYLSIFFIRLSRLFSKLRILINAK